MSTNLSLMKYKLGVQGRYLEDSAERIALSFIGEATLSGLVKVAPLAKLTIYEEDGSDEFSEADCLQNDRVCDAFDFIKSRFVELLKATDVSTIEDSSDELAKSISDFREITNLYYLLEIKCAKYQSDDTVIVKLG